MRFYGIYLKLLRGAVRALAGLAGLAIILMMATTCVDVILRAAGRPIAGSYDLARVLSVLVIACALPYTTALKGHVAVELFFHKLPAPGRLAMNICNSLLVVALFGFMAVQNIKYGVWLRQSGELMDTLHLPVYWIPGVIACACALVALVALYNLAHPGKALLKS